jgi:hypothetical protein
MIYIEDTCTAAPRHTMGILSEALNDVGAKVVPTMLAPGVHRRGKVSERADLMTAARSAGNGAVKKMTQPADLDPL